MIFKRIYDQEKKMPFSKVIPTGRGEYERKRASGRYRVCGCLLVLDFCTFGYTRDVFIKK